MNLIQTRQAIRHEHESIRKILHMSGYWKTNQFTPAEQCACEGFWILKLTPAQVEERWIEHPEHDGRENIINALVAFNAKMKQAHPNLFTRLDEFYELQKNLQEAQC